MNYNKYFFFIWYTILIMFCSPAGLFALVGGAQMLQWALGKHRNYKKEFKDYPRNRKAMIPFIM